MIKGAKAIQNNYKIHSIQNMEQETICWKAVIKFLASSISRTIRMTVCLIVTTFCQNTKNSKKTKLKERNQFLTTNSVCMPNMESNAFVKASFIKPK